MYQCIGLFYPELKHLCIGQGHPMGFHSDVLVGQVIQQKHIPVNALWCRGCSEHLALEDLKSDCWYFEGSTNLLGQPLDIPTPDIVVSCSHQGLYPTGRPAIPATSHSFLLMALAENSHLSLVPQPVVGISRKYSNSSLRVDRGSKLLSSTSPPVTCPQGSLWGLSSEDVSSSGS